MKVLPPGLAAHLTSGATTLCWCWRIACTDGTVLGFTDHDRDVEFDGTRFEAATGFTASEIKDVLGLGVDNLEVESALSSGRLSEADLAAGRYDDAKVGIFRVNWTSPDQHVLMRAGSIGEVRRAGQAFSAEIRGLAHYLQQPAGRLYQYSCDADLGDQRCGVDVSTPAYRATATVLSVNDPHAFIASGLADYPAGWFSRGLATFTSGANAGGKFEIKRHSVAGGMVEIEVWQEPASPLAVGDTCNLTAGCDKQFTTCRARFANGVNFRGFPHMPGNDVLTAVARRGRT